MRHVPLAEFKDKMSEVMAAAHDGEDIVITRHGRDYMRLMPMRVDDVESRRQALARLAEFRRSLRERGFPATTREEIRAWIDEGRR